MSPPSRMLSAALVAATLSLALAVPALADDDDGSSTTTSSSTSSTSSTSTTLTTTPVDESTTSTTEPERSTTTSSTTTTSTTLGPDVVPPDVQAVIDAYPRTPAGSTADLAAVLATVPGAALTGGYGRFPVGGAATWSHDWLLPRHVPSLHFHEGTDVFAERGTPVLSPTAGTATVSDGAVGGRSVRVTQADGTYWYLAHLDEVLVEDGAAVVPGSVVGLVGTTGNAAGGAPHVHVEIHPFGGEPLDPKLTLDAYAAEALAWAPAFVNGHRLDLLRAGVAR